LALNLQRFLNILKLVLLAHNKTSLHSRALETLKGCLEAPALQQPHTLTEFIELSFSCGDEPQKGMSNPQIGHGPVQVFSGRRDACLRMELDHNTYYLYANTFCVA
jgi:hypothetical protein